MSPTEIQARVNQQYRLICDLTNEEINEIIKNNDVIGSLIQYFKNINLYDKYLLDFNILFPMVTPGRITVFPPIHTLSPIVIGKEHIPSMRCAG